VRARAIEADGEIAVMAEDTEAFWQTLADQPLEEGITFADLGPMLIATAVDVVDG
jgi:hypothetical protein